jgi:hypothetical protein
MEEKIYKCKKCCSNLPLNFFRVYNTKRDKTCIHCKKEMKKISDFKRKYNISLEDYNNLLTKQNYKCAICKNYNYKKGKISVLHVDHCHNTNIVRGLLCRSCNIALGHFKDQVNLLEKAIIYVKN